LRASGPSSWWLAARCLDADAPKLGRLPFGLRRGLLRHGLRVALCLTWACRPERQKRQETQ
jgi:hypothetical protein